jgi:hypothetical protein
MKLRGLTSVFLNTKKESFLFSIINMSTFLCAHIRKSLDFFPKVLNKQYTLNEEKITQVKNIEFLFLGNF